jgi:hypothetical protein
MIRDEIKKKNIQKIKNKIVKNKIDNYKKAKGK